MIKPATVFIVAAFFTLQSTALEITGFSPAPNYPRTKDPSDLQQLVDGHYTAYPIWIDAKAVGWAKASPVMLSIVFDGVSGSTGTLKLSSAVGEYAGVMPIKRIDVYGTDNKSRPYVHIGEYLQHGKFKRQKYFAEVNVRSIKKYMSVVIHVEKGGVFLDEVVLTVANEKASESPENKANKLARSSLIQDSNKRLKEQYRAIHQATREQSNRPFEAPIDIEQVDCFDSGNKKIRNGANKPFYIVEGLKLYGQLCFRVINNSVNRELIIDQHAFKVYTLEKQLLRNGQFIGDPLIEAQGDTWSLKSNEQIVFWLEPAEAYLSSKNDGDTAEIGFIANNIKRTFKINLEKRYCENLIDPLHLNVWAYSPRVPVWRDYDQVRQQLYEAGVDIYTVHPNDIPRLTAETSIAWSQKQKHILEKELNYLGLKYEKYLLITAWAEGRNYELDDSGELTKQSADAMSYWFDQFAIFMDEAGLDYNSVLMAPIDEVAGRRFIGLKKIIELAKERHPEIRFYVNPVHARKTAVKSSELAGIADSVGLWQPSLKYVEQGRLDFFESLKAEWFIYENPELPAKSAAPGIFYRGLAWRAWAIGASGIGTWSFDDIRGESAFDDFDGTESDWALVYESLDKPYIPSRRWFALLRGIDDIKLSAYLTDNEKNRMQSGIKNKSIENMDYIFFSAIEQCALEPSQHSDKKIFDE